MKRFVLYLIRWQLSTPILWVVVKQLGASLCSTVIANLIGGVIFFWVDKFIFTSQTVEVWHIKEGKCDKCGGELYQRPDDKEETVKERLKVFFTQTIPILDYYRKQRKLIEVNGNLGIQEVGKQIISVLKVRNR